MDELVEILEKFFSIKLVTIKDELSKLNNSELNIIIKLKLYQIFCLNNKNFYIILNEVGRKK